MQKLLNTPIDKLNLYLHESTLLENDYNIPHVPGKGFKTTPDKGLEKWLKKEAKKQKPNADLKPPTPGSFSLDPGRDPDPFRRAKGKKRKGWKEDARKMRRGKKGKTMP